MKVLVCGGRDFNDSVLLGSNLSIIHSEVGITEIIEGGATGADRLARAFGESAGVPVRTYPADWKKHGKAAGPLRNALMLAQGKPDLVVAFKGGRGTENMIQQAEINGVRVIKINGPWDRIATPLR